MPSFCRCTSLFITCVARLGAFFAIGIPSGHASFSSKISGLKPTTYSLLLPQEVISLLHEFLKRRKVGKILVPEGWNKARIDYFVGIWEKKIHSPLILPGWKNSKHWKKL